jgi:isopenicillin-N epimerase
MASFLREEFDHDPALAYLNWGTHSMTPLRVLDAVQRYQREYESNPTQGYIESYARLWSVQEELAAWFRADPRDLILRTNVSEVMNAFILGMVLEPSCEILATELEYMAILAQCRFRAERDGLALRTFELPTGKVKASALVDAVTSALSEKTRMLVVSQVISGTGIVLPILEIARETRKRGVLLVVDGAHSPGTVSLDFSAMDDVDFFGGNLHKWFMGPKGTAFGWVNRRHQASLLPLQAGWTTYNCGKPFTDYGGGSEFQGRLAMIGCRDFAPFYAIHDTISFWRDHGGDDALRAELYKLQDSFRERLEKELKLEPISPPPGPLRGPLVAFALPPDVDGKALQQKLLEDHRVQILSTMKIKGNFALRVSPHFSSSEDELERAIDALKAELPAARP